MTLSSSRPTPRAGATRLYDDVGLFCAEVGPARSCEPTNDFVSGQFDLAASCRRQTVARLADLRAARIGSALRRRLRPLVRSRQVGGDVRQCRWSLGIVERARRSGVERISRLQSVFAAGRHRLSVCAESPVAQPGRARFGDPGVAAGAAPRFDAGLSGGVVGIALSALPPPRIFARAVVSRDHAIRLHLLHSLQRIDARSTVVRTCPGECSLDRDDERGDDRADPGRVRAARLQIAFCVGVLGCSVRCLRFGARYLDHFHSCLRGAVGRDIDPVGRGKEWRHLAMWCHRFRSGRSGIDRSAVLSGRNRHDVGTWRSPRRQCSIRVGGFCHRPIGGSSYPSSLFARTTCN